MTMTRRNYSPEIIEFGQGFSLEEAVALMNHEVVKKVDISKSNSLEKIGLVSGLSTFKDEIELTISFLDHHEVANKSAFEANYLKVT